MALKYSVSEIYDELLRKISKEVQDAQDDEEKLLNLIDKYDLFKDEEIDNYYYDAIIMSNDLMFCE